MWRHLVTSPLTLLCFYTYSLVLLLLFFFFPCVSPSLCFCFIWCHPAWVPVIVVVVVVAVLIRRGHSAVLRTNNNRALGTRWGPRTARSIDGYRLIGWPPPLSLITINSAIPNPIGHDDLVSAADLVGGGSAGDLVTGDLVSPGDLIPGHHTGALMSPDGTVVAGPGSAGGADLASVNSCAPYLYRCVHCPYQTNYKQRLFEHTSTHLGVKPYSCSICGYKYSKMSNLRRHVREVHEGIKRPTPRKDGVRNSPAQSSKLVDKAAQMAYPSNLLSLLTASAPNVPKDYHHSKDN